MPQPTLTSEQERILNDLRQRLVTIPVGPDGRADRSVIRGASSKAAASLQRLGMHRYAAKRLCDQAANTAAVVASGLPA